MFEITCINDNNATNLIIGFSYKGKWVKGFENYYLEVYDYDNNFLGKHVATRFQIF